MPSSRRYLSTDPHAGRPVPSSRRYLSTEPFDGEDLPEDPPERVPGIGIDPRLEPESVFVPDEVRNATLSGLGTYATGATAVTGVAGVTSMLGRGLILPLAKRVAQGAVAGAGVAGITGGDPKRGAVEGAAIAVGLPTSRAGVAQRVATSVMERQTAQAARQGTRAVPRSVGTMTEAVEEAAASAGRTRVATGAHPNLPRPPATRPQAPAY